MHSFFKNKKDFNQFKKWITALRSGEFKQTVSALQNSKGFCCLGVACKILVPNYRKNDDRFLFGGFPVLHNGAPSWLVDINCDFGRLTRGQFVGSRIELTTLNDSLGWSFDEIADMLELVYIHKAFGE